MCIMTKEDRIKNVFIKSSVGIVGTNYRQQNNIGEKIFFGS